MQASPRFRLRLFAQEFDLRAGTTRIGRSPACEVTIDDPAISREHAVIVVEGDVVVLRDLGSRNGVRVNGVRVVDQAILSGGDRIRVGNQDLVFGKNTSPRPAHGGACPTMIDVTATSEIDQRLTPHEDPNRTTWWLELQTELLQKALQLGRGDEGEGVLRRMEEGIRGRLEERDPYDQPALEGALSAALDLAVMQNEARCVGFVFDTLRSFAVIPSATLAAKVEALPRALLAEARAELRASHRRIFAAADRSKAIAEAS